MSWTDETVATLTRLWKEGNSARQIAAMMGGGITRNAVIGKCGRLSLTMSGKPHQTSRKPAAPKNPRPPRTPFEFGAPLKAKREKHQNSANIVNKKESRKKDPGLVVRPADGPPVDRHLSLVDLGPRDCKWPHGDPRGADYHYCGCETARPGVPYCAWHMGKAYTAAKPATGRPVVVGSKRSPIHA